MPGLFDALKLGAFALPNRIVMAPLTRCRAPGRVPNDMMVEYYRQRASAGLILTEATSVDPMGVGYPATPGLWTAEHIARWRKVTEAVHGAGGRIVLQLWHVGRISDPGYLNGAAPYAPSPIPAEGHVSLLRPMRSFPVPRALSIQQIPIVVAAFRRAAEGALQAGFDGVEVHAANGYLIDQFLQDSANHRTDAYGGPVANRARLLMDITDACIGVWGADRVGVHLSPRGDMHSMGDTDPARLFGHVALELSRRRIAFLFVREKLEAPRLLPLIRKAFAGGVIANEKLTRDSAETLLEHGEADAVAFGTAFLANPDLPRRFAEGAALNTPVPETFYSPGARGYTDYPAMPA
jgi:2,4-dienoyl-CoA reductase-like NADH-dependent reductase (Old Yellow Enzyme family)